VLTKNPPKSLGQWYKVLDVARRWQSQHLRDTAIAHLAKSDLYASVRLITSTKYDIPEWLPDILLDLCLQRSFPSDDMTHLPPSLIPPLCLAREEFRNYLVSRVTKQAICSNNCAWSATHRGRLHVYLSQSLSHTLDLQKPDHSLLTEVFQGHLRNPVSCWVCTHYWKGISADCEAFGKSVVQKHCFPEGERIVQGRGVIVRTSPPTDPMTCVCGKTFYFRVSRRRPSVRAPRGRELW
jgi:hypothetical protein